MDAIIVSLLRLRRLQAPYSLPKDAVAFARHRFKTRRIYDRNLTAADLDQACALEQAGCNGDARPPCPEEPGNNIVREQQIVASNRVARDQQPAAQPLLQRVITIADA